MTTLPDPIQEVAHVLLRAGYTRSEEQALEMARTLDLTFRHPELRWDIDDDQMTPEHRALLKTEDEVSVRIELSEEAYHEFEAFLDRDPVEKPRLRALVAAPTVWDRERERIAEGGHRMVGYGPAEEACFHGRLAHTDKGCIHCACRITYAGGLI